MRVSEKWPMCLMFILVLSAGCRQQPAEPPSVAAVVPGNEIQGSPGQQAKSICLQDPVGTTLPDQDIRSSQRLVRALPQKAQGWLSVGRGWVRKARYSADPGFFVNAEACVDTSLNLEPENPGALGLRALGMMNDHRFKEAHDLAAKILEIRPDDPMALGVLSDAELELGRYEDAFGTVRRMMDIRPDMASYSRASYLYWLRGDTDNAKLLIRDALMSGRDLRDPEPTAWTFTQAAMLFWHEGDYEGAEALLDEALRWFPDYPDALLAKGRVLISRNMPDRAIECLKKTYGIRPLPEAAWLLGDAYAMSGDSIHAESAYERVVRDGRRADRLTLASFYATKGRSLDEALQFIEVERTVRDNAYVLDTYAWILYRLGRVQEAEAAIQKAIAIGTRDARLLFHRGAIQFAAGDPGGRKRIEQALRQNPNFDWSAAEEARTLLRVKSF